MLTDRASNALAGYPAQSMQATGQGAGIASNGINNANAGAGGIVAAVALLLLLPGSFLAAGTAVVQRWLLSPTLRSRRAVFLLDEADPEVPLGLLPPGKGNGEKGGKAGGQFPPSPASGSFCPLSSLGSLLVPRLR